MLKIWHELSCKRHGKKRRRQTGRVGESEPGGIPRMMFLSFTVERVLVAVRRLGGNRAINCSLVPIHFETDHCWYARIRHTIHYKGSL